MQQTDRAQPTGDSPAKNVLPKVGIVGVGVIAEAVTAGICGFGDQRAEILLSPQNEVRSSRLALRYSNVTVSTSNQAVVDGSDIVILAVRPQVTEAVLGALRFRENLHIVSFIAGFSVDQLSSLVAPASSISRAVPLPPVAERQGPVTLYTQSAVVLRLFNGLGHLIRVDDEAHLDLVSAATSLMATYFGIVGAVDDWLVERGFKSEDSRAFVGELFLNLAVAAKKRPEDPFIGLSLDYSTPQGLNEQAWRELRAGGWPDQIKTVLDLILNRIHGRATFETQLPEDENRIKS